MDSLAYGAAPRAPLAVHLQVRLEVEALDVLAVVAARRQDDALERDRALRGGRGGWSLWLFNTKFQLTNECLSYNKGMSMLLHTST